MKWQHSIKTATNLKLTRGGQPERIIVMRIAPLQEGVYLHGYITPYVQFCLGACVIGAWEINVIVNVSVENSYSILELKLLLTLFHNQNHQIPTRIWQTSTWLPVGKLGNSEARVGRKASVHYLMKCELQCHHKKICILSIHALNTCIHLRIVFARKYLTIAS